MSKTKIALFVLFLVWAAGIASLMKHSPFLGAFVCLAGAVVMSMTFVSLDKEAEKDEAHNRPR